MQIVYTGVFDEVEVPVLNLVAKRGEPVEVDSTDAEGLLIQDCWERPNGRKHRAEETS